MSANIFFQLTSDGDTDDFIEEYNGDPVNMSVADWLSVNPTSQILNGGLEYYPDLAIEGAENDTMLLTQSGLLVAQLIAGGHPPRPR